MNLLNEEETAQAEKGVGVFKDPFKKDKVDSISIFIYNENDGGIDCRATVQFQNGDTCGSQNFRTSDFGQIVKDIQSFIKSL